MLELAKDYFPLIVLNWLISIKQNPHNKYIAIIQEMEQVMNENDKKELYIYI